MHIARSYALLLAVAVAHTFVCVRAQTPYIPPNSPPIPSDVVPLPVSMTTGDTAAILSPSFSFICTNNAAGDNGACPPVLQRAFQRYNGIMFFGGTPDTLPVSFTHVLTHMQVVIQEDVALVLGANESYALYVPSSGIATITAPNQWGALRGLETFSQLCIWQGPDAPANSYFITNTPVSVVDFPRFAWRGFLIDTSFNFLTKSAILSVLDAMAYAKLNVLHFHATDDPSWPIESSNFPNFTKNGAYSQQAIYTIADQVDIQQYAADRGILILMELDMPGHAEIWKAGNPDYVIQCPGHQTLLNPIDSSGIYDVIATLIAEYTTRFPGMPYIHLGGDEVRELTCWATDARVQAFMAEKNISDVNALRNYFQLKVQAIAKGLNLNAIMWEEVFLGGYTFVDGSVVTPWISANVTSAAVQQNIRVVNYFSWYLDQQVPPGMDPPAPSGPQYYYWMDTWQTFYNYDPVSTAGVLPAQADMVLGGTASMWGENVDTSNVLARAWPRAAATAERLWSPARAWDVREVEARLEHFRCHIMQRGVPAGPFSVASDHGFCWSPAFAPAPSSNDTKDKALTTAGAVGIAIGSFALGAAIAALALYKYMREPRSSAHVPLVAPKPVRAGSAGYRSLATAASGGGDHPSSKEESWR